MFSYFRYEFITLIKPYKVRYNTYLPKAFLICTVWSPLRQTSRFIVILLQTAIKTEVVISHFPNHVLSSRYNRLAQMLQIKRKQRKINFWWMYITVQIQ